MLVLNSIPNFQLRRSCGNELPHRYATHRNGSGDGVEGDCGVPYIRHGKCSAQSVKGSSAQPGTGVHTIAQLCRLFD